MVDRCRRQDPQLIRRLLRAKDRMSAAPEQDWPVRRLAKVSGVSEAHFSRSFKATFGIPPHRYLLTLRLERAKSLLSGSELSITEVALMTGWSSLGTFSRTFRDVLGQSPSNYRENTPKTDAAPVPECMLRAAERPDLRIAVSEKRRQDPEG